MTFVKKYLVADLDYPSDRWKNTITYPSALWQFASNFKSDAEFQNIEIVEDSVWFKPDANFQILDYVKVRLRFKSDANIHLKKVDIRFQADDDIHLTKVRSVSNHMATFTWWKSGFVTKWTQTATRLMTVPDFVGTGKSETMI